MTDEQLGQMKLIFNYNDVFYSFFYDDLSGCVHRSREYAINYVYSGEIFSTMAMSKFMSEKANASSYRATITLRCTRRRKMVNATAVSS